MLQLQPLASLFSRWQVSRRDAVGSNLFWPGMGTVTCFSGAILGKCNHS